MVKENKWIVVAFAEYRNRFVPGTAEEGLSFPRRA